MYRAIDVMGFAGGFTLGAVQAGFELVGKRELKGGFGVPNCEANRHLLGDRWHAEAPNDPASWTVPNGGAEWVFGNPPCSGFSVMSAQSFRGADSKINHCMWAFAAYVAKVKPQIAVFESVQQARVRPDGHELMKALRAKVERETNAQWDLYHVRHNAYHVGGAAERRRYFWIISRIPFGINLDTPRRKPTLNEVLDDLKGLQATWDAQPYRQPPTWWTKDRRSDSGAVDGHVGIDTPLTRRVLDLVREVGWRPSEAIGEVCRRAYETNGRLPRSFAAQQDKIVRNDFNMGFTTPTRWDGNRSGRVITGAALDTVLHPTEDRMITHREAARVLGFPDDWLIKPIRSVSGLRMTWGKGITVDCGRWIGQHVHNALDENPGDYRGYQIGDREWDIDVTHGQPRGPGRVVTNKTTTLRRDMTDTEAPAPPVDPTEETTAEATTESTDGRRGRPRPESTQVRDAAALELIVASGTAGLTKDELSAQLTASETYAGDVSPSEAYLSIYRLNRDGELEKYRREGKPRWVVKGNVPEPAPAPVETATAPEMTEAPVAAE